ncbi:MAG: carboxypeptidase regulatory-like domain-containing protein [Acidobacteria bacterium]|nr:carboxypeptidase regulatory-like domain-containing protein [Acidobacteriota bacterium]
MREVGSTRRAPQAVSSAPWRSRVAGGIARRTTTARTGGYRFAALSEGTYRIDFDVAGFDLVRQNHVRVGAGTTAAVDATLRISTICECVEFVPATPLRERAGQVLDESDRPLPYSRLEVVSSGRREVAYADQDGRFQVRLPINGTWALTASDSGFRPVALQVSGTIAVPIVFRLQHEGAASVPDTERFARGCRCPGDLFTH